MLKRWLSRYTTPAKLRQAGVLGMNRRNGRYIGRYNPRRLYPLVDNKLKTKLICEKAGITSTKLIGVISNQAEVKNIANIVKDLPGFCIKPAKGSGGKGILVITKVVEGIFFKPNGSELHVPDLERHITNILAGLFSLGGRSDQAIVESLIEFDDVFDGFSFEGVPDVRVIVFLGYPVMAMMRLSTSDSDGKANLHQGAVGVGIDIATGKALRGVQFGQPVTHHPDTGRDLSELQVPHWERLLQLAASCYEMSGLGYLGTDMVLDKRRGPMVLELNARPGLAIQVANAEGLVPRLQLVEKQKGISRSVDERIAFAKQHFARG